MGKVSRSVRKSQSCDKEASTSLQCVASKRSISIKNSNAKEECVIWVVNVESLSNADDASPEDKSVQAAVFRVWFKVINAHVLQVRNWYLLDNLFSL